VFFPVKLQVFLVFISPSLGALLAGFFPGGIFGLPVFEIIGIPAAPFFHIVELALVLALQAGTYLLVGPVFIGDKPFIADRAYSFIGHNYSSQSLS